MDNILKKLIRVRTNLSLCTIIFITEQNILVNLDGDVLSVFQESNEKTIWRYKESNLDPLESAMLDCIITPYIYKLKNIAEYMNLNVINREFSLFDIQDIYREKNSFLAILS